MPIVAKRLESQAQWKATIGEGVSVDTPGRKLLVETSYWKHDLVLSDFQSFSIHIPRNVSRSHTTEFEGLSR